MSGGQFELFSYLHVRRDAPPCGPSVRVDQPMESRTGPEFGFHRNYTALVEASHSLHAHAARHLPHAQDDGHLHLVPTVALVIQGSTHARSIKGWVAGNNDSARV